MTMKKIILVLLSLMTLIFLSCTSEGQEQVSSNEYSNAHLLLNADELHEKLTDEQVFLIDARSDSTGKFVPGAVHFSARGELGDPEHPVSNYLIGPEAFQEKMRQLGLNNDHEVVIMDKGNGLIAARLFYALEYYGFTNASLLNGGLAGWEESGYPTTDEPAAATGSGNFTVDVQPQFFCNYEKVVEASSDPGKIILDVRSEGEYTGEIKRAEKSGHIPNAIHLEWSEVLEPEGVPYFLPAGEIQEMYASVGLTPDKEIIPHCQSNVRGSHTYFTLRLMGYDSVRPYEGSWTEYGNREESVVEQDS